jgi:hypothetical protein
MRKALLLLVTAALCAGLAGCASMKFNYVPVRTQSDWPALNQETTVYIGDEMLIQGYSIKRKVLKINMFVDGICYDIPSGIYAMTGDDNERYYFAASGSGGGVVKSGLCDPFLGITVPKYKNGEVCVYTVAGANLCYNTLYEIIEVESEYSSSYQQSIIYSGIEGKQIKFTYTEKQGARTNFSNMVSYDLGKSTIINYRGARIKIHSANNEVITYTVLENFTSRK